MTTGSISASRDDDLPGLDRPSAGNRGGRTPGGGGRKPNGGGSSIMTNLILMLLVAGLGVGGWYVMNQQALLTEAKSEQKATEARLKVLEDRARATDEVMTDTGEDTKEKLGYWETEIRKVWDVAYKVNRGWIQENQALLAEQKKQLGQVATEMASIKGDLTAQGEGLGDMTERLGALDDLTAKLEGVIAGQDKLAKEIAQIDTSSLSKRIVRNEQAVTAIDAYRVQLNRRLTDLQNRVDGMGPVSGTP